MLDSYLCPECDGFIPEINQLNLSFCINCGKKFQLTHFRKVNSKAQKYLEDESYNSLELLIKSLKIREKVLFQYHKDFEEVYYRLYSYYVDEGTLFNSFFKNGLYFVVLQGMLRICLNTFIYGLRMKRHVAEAILEE